MFKIFTPDEIKSDYIQSKDNKEEIYWKDEPKNRYDNKAVAIYSKEANGNEIKLGYIQKRIYLYKDESFKNVYTNIMDNFKMKALKNQIDEGKLCFHWDSHEETGWLIDKKRGL